MRQHTSAYVSIRQHTSAYVSFSIRLYSGALRHFWGSSKALVRALVGSTKGSIKALWRLSIRQHTSAHVSIRQHTSAYVSMQQHTSACVSIRQHTSAYVSILSAYVSIRQHTSAHVSTRRQRHTHWFWNACWVAVGQFTLWRLYKPTYLLRL